MMIFFKVMNEGGLVSILTGLTADGRRVKICKYEGKYKIIQGSVCVLYVVSGKADPHVIPGARTWQTKL